MTELPFSFHFYEYWGIYRKIPFPKDYIIPVDILEYFPTYRKVTISPRTRNKKRKKNFQ